MSQQSVSCPECGHEFELGKAWTDKVSQDLRAELEVEVREKLKEVEERQAKIDEELTGRLDAERDRLAADARSKVEEELGVQFQAVQDELKEKSQKLAEARETELELRKKERELKDRQEDLELELVKRVDEERARIIEEAKAKADEQQHLKLREKDNLIRSLNDQIGDLKRRVEVGSQESQGEALEGELIDILRRQFSFDECEEIKKGHRGADILQRVRNSAGKVCGTILWETKNAKNFANDWIDKLKKDQQEAGADLAVLMTMAMPADIEDFDLYQEVWVTNFASAMSLCGVLRQMLISVERERLVSRHKEGMKEVIYTYITGNEFSQHVKMIVTAYQKMKADLLTEQNSMNRIWKRREKQISSVLDNVSGMYGEIEGLLIGDSVSLPKIEALSLEAMVGDEDE